MTELEERSLDSIERQLAAMIDRRNRTRYWRKILGLFLVITSAFVLIVVPAWLLIEICARK